MRFLVAFICSLVVCSSASFAKNIGAWNVEFYPDNNAPTGCMMGADYNDGTRVNLIVTDKYEWALGFFNSAWDVAKNSRTDVTAFVDGHYIASGSAIAISNKLILLPLSGASAYRALQIGYSLHIKAGQNDFRIKLTGTEVAMAEVLNCVKTIPTIVTQQIADEQKSSDFAFVPQAEATVLLTNLLNGASIGGYKLAPPKSGDQGVNYNFADGSSGYFVAGRGNTADADTYVGTIIANDSKRCNGEFLTGKQSVPSTDGSVVRKVATTCKTGGISQMTETTVIRRPDGFLMSISHSFGESTPGLVEGETAAAKNDSALLEAALKLPISR